MTVNLKIRNLFDKQQEVAICALVDTGASHLVLPLSMRRKIGKLLTSRREQIERTNGKKVSCIMGGPVQIAIGKYAPVHSDLLFVDMNGGGDGHSGGEPLLGYIPLEQARLVVDMARRRITQAKAFDLKGGK